MIVGAKSGILRQDRSWFGRWFDEDEEIGSRHGGKQKIEAGQVTYTMTSS